MINMKKKIVSLILTVVMVVLALVSCGSNSIVERDLSQYVEGDFDKAAFYEALSKLQIVDGDYSSDPAIRAIVEQESFYNSVADAFIKTADKLKEGTVGADDILYFCYYTTYTDPASGKTYTFDLAQMKLASVTDKDNANKHVIKLGTLSTDDDNYEFNKALADALSTADIKDYIYSVISTTGTKVELTTEKPEIKVVVSYNRAHTEDVNGDDGSITTKTYNEIVSYEVITLSKPIASTDPLVEKLIDSKTTLTVGKNATVSVTTPATDTEEAKTEQKSTFDVTVKGVDGAKDTIYTYSDFKVQWIIDSELNEFATFEFDSKVDKLVTDGLHTKDETVDLKDKKLTYHIYPVYYYDIPEINAESFIKYALGSKLAVSSLDVFSNEKYKSGDKTIKALVEALIEIYSIDSDSTKSFDKNSDDALIKKIANIESKTFDKNSTDFDIQRLYHYSNLQAITKSAPTDDEKAALDAAIQWMKDNVADEDAVVDFFDIKKEYDDAKKAVDDAGSSATTTQTAALTTAHTKYKTIATELYKSALDDEYDDALEEIVDAKIAAILACENAEAEEALKSASAAIIAEKKEDIKKSEIDAYNEYIITEVGKAVYQLILDSVTIKSYPEDLVKEFYDHLYESYEYEYYKGDYDSKTSNYSKYGSLKEYLVAATEANTGFGGDYVKAIEAKAKEYLAPMIKIYVVAKALESDAVATVPGFVEKDILAGAYDANYKYDDSISDRKNQKAEAKAEKEADKAKAEARDSATKFLVTDAVYKEYKKSVGSAIKTYEDNYGERNLRLALQFNKLFYYLISNDFEIVDEDDTKVTNVITEELTVDGKTVIKVSFRNEHLNYSFKEATEEEKSDSASN